ncbi:MAG: NifB/NifX family molybdenum-iron cluster-binding protein [Candidatus Thermoplasmatota archaeon]
MKIAIASDDGTTIAHHFGRAAGFVVYTIKDDAVIHKEYRNNHGKSTGECHSCNHETMIRNIQDCSLVISYGMGRRIYDDLISHNIQPIVTDEVTVDVALEKYLKRELNSRTEKLH